MYSMKNSSKKGSIKSDQITQNFQPLNLLEHFAYTYRHGCLEVYSKSLSWWIYLRDGQLIYASHTSNKSIIYSLNRLKIQLRNINHKAFYWLETNTNQLLNSASEDGRSNQLLEYQVICWLAEQNYLESWQAINLFEQSTRETIESFLSLTEGATRINGKLPEIRIFCELEPKPTIEYCQTRLQTWQSLDPLISSPHQRPYIVNQDVFCQANDSDVISPRLKSKLVPILQGYSIRHVATLLQQDELEIAKFLYPYIENQSIVLRSPEPPFDRLLSLESSPLRTAQKADISTSNTSKKVAGPTQSPSLIGKQGSHIVIACVDDSPNTLNQIENFLDNEDFLVFKFLEPIKATFQLRRIKPDLILMDLTMPKISGYELCKMLRNLPGFENIPVVMVTGKKGVVDKVRAKLVGATDYLEKPFTRTSLLDVISRNLA